ncbi:faeA [Symbiodinium natans]|uniref:FaeA protein n=1 Tax=Symbiodinium natans TaxID=878477 RepID=A0A812IEJ4_9DINO|nr:faeA [Symbiodinium natans]
MVATFTAFVGAWLAGLHWASATSALAARFDQGLAEKYLWIQQLTIMPAAELARMDCGLACEMLPEVAQVHVTEDSGPLNTRGLVATYGGDDCLVSFKGSTSITNYLLGDFDILLDRPFSSCPDCRVHKGFYNSWRSLQDETQRALEDLGCDKKPLRVSGHSLGGAMALLAAFQLSEKYQIKEIYTFGQPRVGNEAWVNAFEARMANASFFRVVSYMDPVPHLPPSWLMGYRHVGAEVWYNTTSLGSPAFCAAGQEDCSGQFSVLRCLFHTCDHCSYLGLNPCKPNDPHPACLQGAGYR